MKKPAQGLPVGPTSTSHLGSEFSSQAVAVLMMLRDRERLEPASVRDALGLSTVALGRILSTLHFQGMLSRSGDGASYTAGPALIELAVAVVRRIDLRARARPHLERLARELGETVHLMTLHGADAVFLDSVESEKVLRVGARVGQSLPAHASAGGKVLLADLPLNAVHRLFGEESIPTLTGSTLATRTALDGELEAVRNQGYATNVGETERDVIALAVAVRGESGRTLAALSLSAPRSRFDPTLQDAVVSRLRGAAAEIGAVGT